MDIDDLAARFQSCTLPKHEWTHAAHLRVGLWHVHRHGADEALTRLRTGIRRLNESHGGVNSATDGYHETITVAYVTLLAQYLQIGPRELSLPERAERLLASPLAHTAALSAFYSRDTLMSITARARWVEPDIAPLRLAAVLDPVRSEAVSGLSSPAH
jgi:hypothetical protein